MNQLPLNNIFHIQYGNQFDLYKLESNEESEINFISRTSQNLGVIAKVSKLDNVEPFPAGLITVTLGGSYLLSSFIQEQPFYTAQNIKVLTSKYNMSYKEKLFYCMAIKMNRFKYTSHGREANKTLDLLMVPSTVPSKFKNINIDKILEVKSTSVLEEKKTIDTNSFITFDLGELFTFKSTKTTPVLKLKEVGEGKYPYVTTQATNNGVEGLYNCHTEDGKIITFDSAVIGYCAYQPLPFSASDHIEKMIPKFVMNKYIAIFLVTILNQEQYRYNYGRKCSQARMKKIKIKLPVKNGKPDWTFMECFIKSLPYSSSV